MQNKILPKDLEAEAHSYSLYVIEQRSLCALTDGLKAGARRVLWTGRNGDTYKSAALAGATLKYHPHNVPETAINTAAGRYINNICLLSGEGAFGTRLNMDDGFGASRYTSVKISQFTKDVVFADLELIPMKDNYDMTDKEPIHFLPLVPIVIINQSSGIAHGFASEILPRRLEDVITDMCLLLNDKLIKVDAVPYIKPLQQSAESVIIKDQQRYLFKGSYEVSRNQVIVTDLPYGFPHSAFIQHLNKLCDAGEIADFTDGSSDQIKVTIKLTGAARKTEAELRKLLKLDYLHSENLNVLDVNHKTVKKLSYTQLLEKFTSWRLEWYKQRLALLIVKAKAAKQKVDDVIIAYDAGITALLKEFANRKELKQWLEAVGVVDIDMVSSLAAYRFVAEEISTARQESDNLAKEIAGHQVTMSSPAALRQLYIKDLQGVLKKYKAGTYDTDFNS